MSKAVREFFEQIKEGVQESCTLRNILGDIKTELTQQAQHGAHEMASALFRGDAFVMYPRTNQADTPTQETPEVQQEQTRGGMEM